MRERDLRPRSVRAALASLAVIAVLAVTSACASPASGKLELLDTSGTVCGQFPTTQSGIFFHERLKNLTDLPITVDRIRFARVTNGHITQADLTTVNAVAFGQLHPLTEKLGSGWTNRLTIHGSEGVALPASRTRDLNFVITRADSTKPMIGRDVIVTYTADGSTTTIATHGLVYRTPADGRSC